MGCILELAINNVPPWIHFRLAQEFVQLVTTGASSLNRLSRLGWEIQVNNLFLDHTELFGTSCQR